MNSFQTALKSAISDDAEIPLRKRAYFTGALKNDAHDLVLRVFQRAASEEGCTKAKIAKRIAKRPEQVTRWLGSSGNWTMDTLAEVLLAMGYKAKLDVVKIEDLRAGNYQHPAIKFPTADFSSVKTVRAGTWNEYDRADVSLRVETTG